MATRRPGPDISGRSEAREDRAKAEAGKAGVLHFATHATLNNAASMYSRLLLSPGGGGEDGSLEARELLRLDLKASLAVLSACETACGRFGAGEGTLEVARIPSVIDSDVHRHSSPSIVLIVAVWCRRRPRRGVTGCW